MFSSDSKGSWIEYVNAPEALNLWLASRETKSMPSIGWYFVAKSKTKHLKLQISNLQNAKNEESVDEYICQLSTLWYMYVWYMFGLWSTFIADGIRGVNSVDEVHVSGL